MAALKSYAPLQLSNLFEGDPFDGDLSSADSESDSSMTPVASLARTPPKQAPAKKGNSIVKATPRPRRQEAVKSYAESDTDEELTPATPSSKRKRNGSHNESPTKKIKLDVLHSPRGRSFSAGQVPSRTPTENVAAWSNTTALPLRPPLKARKRMFVRLGLNGEPVVSTSSDGYWWPAKKVETSDRAEGLVYQLYGDDGHGSGRNVTIQTPQPTNLQSIYHPQPPLPRYSPASFQHGSEIESSSFLTAFTELNQDDEDDDDDDDDCLQEEVSVSDGEHAPPPSHSSASDWRPPSPSEFNNLVDQHVWCRSKRGSTIYWPARVMNYIAPTKASQKPRFEVEFFDWKISEVTRDMFFTQYDDDEKGFVGCELDRRKLQEWIDKNSLSPTESGNNVEIDISNLPKPCFPIPKPAVFIDQVPIEEQFVYVIPFMQRILEETYAPSQERIDAWMSGGSMRIGITNNPIQGGHLAEVEWHIFGRLVHNWALPGFNGSETEPLNAAEDDPHFPVADFDARKNSSFTPISKLTTRSPKQPNNRPQGSNRYERLPLGQKLQFLVDVLIGEAVIQLLIIRAGKRSDLNLLGDAEEAELYQYGITLSRQESTSLMVGTILEERRDIRKRLALPPEPLIAAGVKSDTATEIGARRNKTRIHSK